YQGPCFEMKGILSLESRIFSKRSSSLVNSGLLASSLVLTALRSRTQLSDFSPVTSSSQSLGSCCSWPETVFIVLTKTIRAAKRLIAYPQILSKELVWKRKWRGLAAPPSRYLQLLLRYFLALQDFQVFFEYLNRLFELRVAAREEVFRRVIDIHI